MKSEADNFWDDVVGKIRKAKGLCPLTPAEADAAFDDAPAFRVDLMPYGGVRDSGLGREGPRWAVEEMTEPRLLVLGR
jgi:hypothetical protein